MKLCTISAVSSNSVIHLQWSQRKAAKGTDLSRKKSLISCFSKRCMYCVWHYFIITISRLWFIRRATFGIAWILSENLRLDQLAWGFGSISKLHVFRLVMLLLMTQLTSFCELWLPTSMGFCLLPFFSCLLSESIGKATQILLEN